MKNSWLTLFGVFLVGVLGGWYLASAQLPNSNSSSNKLTQQAAQENDTVSLKEHSLALDMRKLWEDHLVWTKTYIVSAVNDLDDKDLVLARLLRNQEDIGNAMKTYYGSEAGDRLTGLLKEHINIAGELVGAAASRNNTALSQANTKWIDNGNQIADFLAGANPNWPKDQMRSMMKNHLDLTRQEAVDIINKNGQASITDYDRVHDQILKMADMFSSGIVKQFPDKF